MSEAFETKHYWLYFLKLEHDKYYVGITARYNPELRIQQHYSGYYGAKWTKKYPPVQTLETRSLGEITKFEAEAIEQNETLKLMKRYGYQNVRGGGFNYSGRYVYRFHRFFTDDNWETLTIVVLLMLVIIYLLIDKYFF